MRIKNLEPFDLDSATRAKPGGRIYGGGGGSSSSSASTSSTTQNTDQRLVVDNGGFGVSGSGSSLTVNTSDKGLVAATQKILEQSSRDSAAALKGLTDSLNSGVQSNNALAISGLADASNIAQAGLAGAEKLAGQAIVSNASNFTTLLDTARMMTLSAINTQTANTALAKDLAGSTQANYQDSATVQMNSKNIMLAVLGVAGIFAFTAMGKK